MVLNKGGGKRIMCSDGTFSLAIALRSRYSCRPTPSQAVTPNAVHMESAGNANFPFLPGLVVRGSIVWYLVMQAVLRAESILP